MTESLQTLTARLSAATKAATTEITDLRQRIATAQQALETARTALVPMEEFEARVRRVVQDAAAHWLDQHGRSLVYGLGQVERPDLRGVKYGAELLTWGAFCAAQPDAAVTRVLDLARQVPYEAGSSSADRPALLKQLARELATLEAAEEAAIDVAQAAGLTIAHRPEVTTRRADETRRRELEAERVAHRQQRQAALDAAYVPRTRLVNLDVPSRTTRSAYIESSGRVR